MPCEGLPHVVPNDQNLKWGYRVNKTFLISLVLLLYTLYPLYSCIEGIHAFCDFTIRDSVSGLNFMNSPLLRDFEEKNILMMNILLMMDNYSCQSDSF